jgi:IclR family transcriptional regulator, mhp operon transcriptional activator
MAGPRVLGCLNIIWIDAALAFEVATRRFLPLLRQAAQRIEREYAKTVEPREATR